MKMKRTSISGVLDAARQPSDQEGHHGDGRQPRDDRPGRPRVKARPGDVPGVQGQGRGAEEGGSPE